MAKRIIKKYGQYLLIIAILLLALFLRVYRLDIVPAAVVPDEVDFVMAAKAVAWTGFDLSGRTAWWSMQSFQTNTSLAEWSWWYQLPTAWLPTSVLNTKIMPVIYGMLLVAGLGMWMWLLTGNRRLAYAVMVVVAVNPWAIYLSRIGNEAAALLATGVWSLVCLTKWRKTGSKKWLVGWLMLFLLTFFTYQGVKIPLVALTGGWLAYFGWRSGRVKTAGAMIALILVVLGGNAAVMMQTDKRAGEILLPNNEQVAEEVGWQRRNNLEPSTLMTKVWNNKLIVWGQMIAEHAVMYWDVSDLFVTEEGTNFAIQTVPQDSAYFYVVELIFLVWGVVKVASERRYWWLVLGAGSVVAAGLSSTVKASPSVMLIQACLLLPILASAIGYGVVAMVEAGGKRAKWVGGVIVVVYLVSLSGWGQNYFVRFPVYAADEYMFDERVLARYLWENKDREVLVLLDDGELYNVWQQFVFYNNLYTKETAKQWQETFVIEDKTDRKYQDITFTYNCDRLDRASSETTIITRGTATFDDDGACRRKLQEWQGRKAEEQAGEETLNIVRVVDNGSRWRIYDDKICAGENLPQFVHLVGADSLRMEKMSKSRFCEEYVVEY